ncbi:hypothetical protein BGZ68_004550 [Mortierella alpina]|nr:hypothetical protein BGZ68_004550 [Mortierella alpina]
MCALYSSCVSSSSSSHKAFASVTIKSTPSTPPSLQSTTLSPPACSAKAKKMKNKAPVLCMQQQLQQPSAPQTQPCSQRLSHNLSSQRHQNTHLQLHQPAARQQQQPARIAHVRRISGNAGQKHQHFHQQQQQQHSIHHSFDHAPCPLQYPQQSYRQTHSHPSNFHSSKGLQRPAEDAHLQPTMSLPTPVASETEEALAPGSASAPVPAPAQAAALSSCSTASSHPARKQSGALLNSSSGVLSSAPDVTQTVSAARRSDAQNSDPEPLLGDVEQYIHQQQLFLQSNRRHHDKGPSKRLHMAAGTSLGLCPPALDSDMSSASSLREGSEFETDDDKGILGGSSDSNDTDSLLGDAVEMDRRSRRKRSMQRLVAKNKMLKSSLLQAKADLAAERHSRAMIDQIYLKIKKELNSKLEAEEIKVAHLKADLEQMTQEMNELKEKSTPSTSYRIGYDSSPYSLSSGLGGLMLHHSNLIDSQDDSDEFISTSRRTSTTPTICKAEQAMSLTSPPESPGEEEEEVLPPFGWRANENQEAVVPFEDDCNSNVDESPKKVVFLSTSADTLTKTPSPRPAVKADVSEDSDADNDEEEAPCTMMEMLIKKQRSQSPEDDVQDPPADANETFDSMAHKFLHQALRAKFTPARTILQLDDLLLKYDAVLDNLVLVLAQEFMKWWEHERSEAGGPAIGGWGTGTVLIPETGERVSAKIAVESKFKSIYVPLLLNYVASHQEQMLLLEKLEQNAKTSAKLMRNHLAQLMALYKFDVLEADAILEWWKLLKEPEGIFGHGDGLRSMSSKFVAWLEDEEDDSDEDEDDDSDDDEDGDGQDESDCEDEAYCDDDVDVDGQGKILGLELLTPARPGDVLRSLDEVLAKDEAEQEELMVIGSDDENAMDDQMSTTSSLERIEECERKRRISFCTNNVYINQDGRVRVDKAPTVDKQRSALTQCPPMREESEEEEDQQDNQDEDEDDEQADDVEH